jgi:azurin
MPLSTLVFLLVVGFASFTPAAAAQPRKAVTPAVKPAPNAVRTVEIEGSDAMKYSIATIPAKRGERLRIRLISKGTIPKVAMAHNVVVLGSGTDIPKLLADGAAHRDSDFIPPAMTKAVIAKTPFAGPGETVDVTFVVPSRPGTYPFICTFAGHYQAGMKGTLVVK